MNEFIRRYCPEDINTKCPKYKLWVNKIVPSCVVDPTNHCALCTKRMISTPVLIRHYREQHYDSLPEGIFGSNCQYICLKCDREFTRKDHLSKHLKSAFHLRDLVPVSIKRKAIPEEKIMTKRIKTSSVITSTQKDNSCIPIHEVNEALNDSNETVISTLYDSDDICTPKTPRLVGKNAFNDDSLSQKELCIEQNKQSGIGIEKEMKKSSLLIIEKFISNKGLKKSKTMEARLNEQSIDFKIDRALSDYTILNLSI